MARTFVLIEIKAPTGREDATRERFTHVITTSHKPGMLSAQIFESESSPGTLYSLQEWEDEAAFRAHMSESDSGLRDSADLLDGPPRLTIVRSIDVPPAV